MHGTVGGWVGCADSYDPRGQHLSTKPCTAEGFSKHFLYCTGAKISRSGSPICFFHDQILLRYRPNWGNGACIFKTVWRRGGYGWISGGTRMLEVAAESREASLGYGARSTLINMLTSSRPKARKQHDTDSEEDCRDGRSGEVWRRRSSGQVAVWQLAIQ
jgi:hypothetical protein